MKRYFLRRFMHPPAEDQAGHLAFRPREKDKMKLRRNARQNEQDVLNMVNIVYC